MITARTQLCMVIGDPVTHSLSPIMHNAAYAALGIDGQFVFVARTVATADIAIFLKAARAIGIRGIACTLPHKREVMKYLAHIDPVAKTIGAVNTIVCEDGILTGYNTDWPGAVLPLENVTSLAGKEVAILGAGGVARAIIYGVKQRGARVTIYNRTEEKAKHLAKEMGVIAKPFTDIGSVRHADIIINATAIGMYPNTTESPIPNDCIESHHIVFDAVYVPLETALIKAAKKKGAQTIVGAEMFLHQGMEQFFYFTNRKAPEDVMREILYKTLQGESAL